MRLLIFLTLQTATILAGVCRDTNWQPIADNISTPDDQRCHCSSHNITMTEYDLQVFYDLSFAGKKDLWLQMPYDKSNVLTKNWNTDCQVQFALQSVTAFTDTFI